MGYLGFLRKLGYRTSKKVLPDNISLLLCDGGAFSFRELDHLACAVKNKWGYERTWQSFLRFSKYNSKLR